ncbi:MAG: hypothetical protein AAF624_01585 [Bacteroidota bacterium]
MTVITTLPAVATPVEGVVGVVRVDEPSSIVAIQDVLVVAVLLLLVVLLLP